MYNILLCVHVCDTVCVCVCQASNFCEWKKMEKSDVLINFHG